MSLEESIRDAVRTRAQGICEYCHFPEDVSYLPFQVDHIIATKHGGLSGLGNLAWSCYYCNTYKGPNIAGWNVETQEPVRLYNPRRDQWDEHFAWNGSVLEPRSAIGSATIEVLVINHPDAIAVRRWFFDADST